jgi:rhamnose utilization protein RhaD (predicted bifunctional aldolase and dehydrogenase)/NAD(P)-dependent dehydrogenase (short-subunit alcohol dehydrogenase family)
MTQSSQASEWESVESVDLDLATPLGACCHGSRLLGSDPTLVLHGGGNTSVKTQRQDISGEPIDALLVKGSGWDLGSIKPAGFAPLRMTRLKELLRLDAMTDEEMARELAASKLDPNAPQPSVEALLHAFLPFAAVQHSHADCIVGMTNTSAGEANAREIYGENVVVIPYVMPGFDLAKVVRDLWPQQAHSETTGMVLLNHGLFTFGASTREAYERHLTMIAQAQEWIEAHPEAANREDNVDPAVNCLGPVAPIELAELRRDVSGHAGRPMILSRHTEDDVASYVQRGDLADIATRGPLTPDHVIRTKRVAQIGTDVAAYANDYVGYFDTNQARKPAELEMLDPAPRIILDPSLGMLTIGTTAKAADIAADIYHHTIDVVTTSEDRLGGYVALPAADIFDVEYWDLEQAKLSREGSPPELAGQVALVTGAASGIGRACARELLARGAAVVGLDLSESVAETFAGPAYLGIQCDVSDAEAQAAAVHAGVERFGGLDIVIVAAGILGASQRLDQLDLDAWRKTMSVNVDSVASLFSVVGPLLAVSPTYGRVIMIGSKNVSAPGRGAAAYSASKAALTQLAKVAALEWADAGVRINSVHPDAVFDTGLWSDEILAERASNYGLTVEEYKTRNLLGTEVDSATVAAMVASMCGPAFAATTGAQIPIDGGNERVI